MKHDTYVAYDADSGEYETFDDLEKAKEWLLEMSISDNEISIDVECGYSYIAKVTHRSKFIKTDEKSNYDDEESWPYSKDFDYVGEVKMVEV